MKSSRLKVKSWFAGIALAMLSMFSTSSAYAADGCKFLLCIAGPWSSISQCVPTVHQVFRDVARGRPFPTCNMGSANNFANNTWVDQKACPSMYQQYDLDSRSYVGCSYPGRISVYVNGDRWSDVFWTISGNTSTWYSPTARTLLTQQAGSAPLDDRFLTDLNGWNLTQGAQCRSGGGPVELDMFGAVQRCTPLSGGER